MSRIKYLLFVIPICLLALASCRRMEVYKPVSTTFVVDNEVVNFKEIEFINESSAYPSSRKYIPTYFFGNSQIPYITIEDYIGNISYYDNKLIKKDNFLYVEENENNDRKLQLIPSENKIVMHDYNFFSIDEKQIKSSLDYYKYLNLKFVEENNDYNSIIDLNNYNLEIKEVNGLALLPFHVINTIFSSESYYYVNYVGDKYYGTSYEDDTIAMTTLKNALTIAKTQEYLEYNFNIIKFVFNEFYGLYDERKTIIDNLDSLKQNFLSGTESTEYINFLSSLEDCHTSNLYLNDFFEKTTVSVYGGRRQALENAFYEDYNAYNAFMTKYKQGNNTSYYSIDSKTVLIPIFEFNVSGDSSPLNIRKILDKCKNSNIENIIFDVGLNGGGDTFALAFILGLMTDDDIVLKFTNVKNKHTSKEIFKIDANLDGSFDDNDAYDSFNYFVLSSGYSFSCANDFINYCKEKKLATVIGQKSGGGGCCVYPLVTPNGMLIQTSGLNGLYNSKGELIEFGVSPDYYVNNGSNYDVYQLINIINSVNNK